MIIISLYLIANLLVIKTIFFYARNPLLQKQRKYLGDLSGQTCLIKHLNLEIVWAFLWRGVYECRCQFGSIVGDTPLTLHLLYEPPKSRAR